MALQKSLCLTSAIFTTSFFTGAFEKKPLHRLNDFCTNGGGRNKEKDALRAYLIEIDWAHNATQEKFMARSPTRGIICHEVIVDG